MELFTLGFRNRHKTVFINVASIAGDVNPQAHFRMGVRKSLNTPRGGRRTKPFPRPHTASRIPMLRKLVDRKRSSWVVRKQSQQATLFCRFLTPMPFYDDPVRFVIGIAEKELIRRGR